MILKVLTEYWLTTWALLAAIFLLIPKQFPLPPEGAVYWIIQIFILPAAWISKILFYGFGIAGDYILFLSMPFAIGIAYYINKTYL